MTSFLQVHPLPENPAGGTLRTLAVRGGRAQNIAVLNRRQFLSGLLAAVSSNAFAAPAKDSLVDLNHASLDELMTLPGMTRTWAARIVRFRPYRVKNELVDRGVVTGEVYARIKDSVIAHREKQ